VTPPGTKLLSFRAPLHLPTAKDVFRATSATGHPLAWASRPLSKVTGAASLVAADMAAILLDVKVSIRFCIEPTGRPEWMVTL